MKPRLPAAALRLRHSTVAALASFFALSCASTPPTPFDPSRDCFREVTTALADDRMEGRGIGTEGLDRATDYLVDLYGELDLEAMRSDSPAPSFRQTFDATIGVRAGEGNALEWSDPANEDRGNELTFREDFMPFGFSSSQSQD